MKTQHKSTTLSKGLAVYKTNQSPYYNVRIWNPRDKKYLVRSTKKTVYPEAVEVAHEIYKKVITTDHIGVRKEHTFSHFADELLRQQGHKVRNGDLSKDTNYQDKSRLFGSGKICSRIGDLDIREIGVRDIRDCVDSIMTDIGSSSASTENQLLIVVRKVLNTAIEMGGLDNLPLMPSLKKNRSSQRPRLAFKFAPLVSDQRDEYKKLLETTKSLIGREAGLEDGFQKRYVKLDQNIYDLILFTVHSFLRPSLTELFALRHIDVERRDNPRRLQLKVRGKTGFRYVDTLEACVTIYERILERNPKYEEDDYLFYPQYKNRQTAQRIAQRTFSHILEVSKLKTDRDTDEQRSLYSLRHTAIQMRLVKSKGKVNIYNLARNCGTSVEMIERFYTKYLPNSDGLASNLHSFGE